MISDEEILASLARLREDVEQMRQVVAYNISRAPLLPHRRRYMLLQQDLGRRLLDAHAEWLDAVAAELGDQGSV
jgi:hypothetical protein